MQITGGIDWAAVTGMGSILASLATLILVSYNGGKLTQKVETHGEKFVEQAKTNLYVNEKIDEHTRAIGRLDGYDLASRHHGTQTDMEGR